MKTRVRWEKVAKDLIMTDSFITPLGKIHVVIELRLNHSFNYYLNNKEYKAEHDEVSLRKQKTYVKNFLTRYGVRFYDDIRRRNKK